MCIRDSPIIAQAPDEISYQDSFSVQIDDNMPISEFNFVRSSSVTHGINTDQRFVPVNFTRNNNTYQLTAPKNGNIAPPGFYMLFAINRDGIPSVASIVKIG